MKHHEKKTEQNAWDIKSEWKIFIPFYVNCLKLTRIKTK